jgi:hypothetical protein
MAKTKETIDPKEAEIKAKKLIEDIKKIIEDKLKDKTFSKNNPFIEESDQTNPNDSLPDPLKDFGKEEEKNWIFYGPPGTGKTFALNKIQILSLCINETKEERNILNKFWNLTKSDGKNWTFKLINRVIGIPFNSIGIKIYLECDIDRNKHNHKYLINKIKNKKLKVSEFWNAGTNFEFRKRSDSKEDYKILPTLQNDHIYEFEINDLIYETTKKWVKLICDKIFASDIHVLSVVKKIVFHPSYTYEDFVGGIKPDLEKKDLTDHQSSADGSATQEGLTKPNLQPSLMYKYTPGVMLDLIRKAWVSEVVRHYLIIDEFNRGNIAAIFGEFLYLIENDKRSEKENSGNDYVFLPGGIYPWNDKEKVEPFSEECKIRMPRNIFIVGALNTADRSIATMDFAMRRRFNFVKFEPNEKLIKGFDWTDKSIKIKADSYLKILFVSLNKSISYKLDPDHEIGHYYFMPSPESVKNKTETFLEDLFKQKIISLLEAYCDHDKQAVNRILALTLEIYENLKTINKVSLLKDVDVDEKIKFIKKLSTQELRTLDRKFSKDSKTEELIKVFWDLSLIKEVII